MYMKRVLDEKMRRDMCVDRVDVLDRVKPVMTIPGTDLLTLAQAADYFEVDNNTLYTCITRNSLEFAEDDTQFFTPKHFHKMMNEGYPIKNIQNLIGKALIEFDNGFALYFPNRGTIMIHKRTLIRIAFLLRDSEVGSRIRTMILECKTCSDNSYISTKTRKEEDNILYKSLIQTIIGDNVASRLEAVGNLAKIYNQKIRTSI